MNIINFFKKIIKNFGLFYKIFIKLNQVEFREDIKKLLNENECKLKKNFKFQNLELKKIIKIPKTSFNRDFFSKIDFNIKGKESIKLVANKNFENIFLPLVNKIVNYKGGKILKLKLKKEMNDFQIKKEFGNRIQNPDIIALIIRCLILKKQKSEIGYLDDPHVSYILHFEDENNDWYIRLFWFEAINELRLYCLETDNEEWDTGSIVFDFDI